MTKSLGRPVFVFLSFFALVGVLAIGFGFWNLWRSLRSSSWPNTEGVVRSAEMKSQSDNDGGTTYSPEITYGYEVAGVKYEGNRLAFGSMSASSGYAHGVLNRYPKGQKVTVYYSPDDPQTAVLETGIHGGTWKCFGVGVAFVLAAVMFMQILRPAGRAQSFKAPGTSSVKTQPDGTVTMNKPPVFMGMLFIIAGSPLFFVGTTGGASNGTPNWVIYAAGAMFVGCGLFILSLRLENKIYNNILKLFIVAAFLAIFHWVSFGAGDRIGTSSTPFSVHHGVNVRTPFAIFTVIVDVLLVGGLVHKLLKRRGK